MKTVGSYEAKTHLPRLLSQVEQGETITITKRGRPVAVLSPARTVPERDVKAVIAEFRAYSQANARRHGSLSPREIKQMTEEGRP
jgi:prevent-host-death family protein